MDPAETIGLTTSDGTVLLSDVYLPSKTPAPVVLMRTAYDRTSTLSRKMIDIDRCLERGYAVVMQDTRGRFSSDGTFSPFHQEMADGRETVDWVGSRQFSNGDVVMAGSSYLGATQWLAAIAGPEHLRAIAPALSASDIFEGWIYQGGAFQLAFNLFWALVHLLPEEQRRRGIEPASIQANPAYRDKADDTSFAATASHSLDVAGPWLEHLPLGDIAPLLGAADFYNTWLAAPHAADPYWKRISPERNAWRISCPVLVVSGWYQLFLRGAYEGYRAVTSSGATEVARNQSRMIIGPWENSLPGPENTTAGALDFGQSAGIPFTDVQLDFFDDVLGRGSPRPASPVRYFVMGANEWRDTVAWPVPGTRWRTLFVGPYGTLSETTPTDEEAFDSTVYDPTDPVPTLGGCTVPGLPQGPQDHSDLDERPDSAVYRTEPLQQPMEIVGPVRASVHFSASSPSTDITVTLSIEHADGRVMNLCDGITRWTGDPGDAHVEVDLLATAVRVERGDRLHLRISHSNFPRFDRNLGTGEPSLLATRMSTVTHRIYRNRKRATSVLLPIGE